MTDRNPRREYGAVAVAMLFAVAALYAAFGGPIPFLAPGGPALDAVPAEADAVAYANAWTFTRGSSQGVADGLLSITNESLPGYTGPASLEEAVATLEASGLRPSGLRSMTAFGRYGPAGGASEYRGVILKTTWGEAELLAAVGGSADAYEETTYGGKTLYTTDEADTEWEAVAVLGPDSYVMGNESAVRDSVSASVSDGDEMDGTLRSGFRSLPRGPIRFSATTPERLPGSDIAPQSLRTTVDGIETVGGVYYPRDGNVAVELSIRTRDAETARTVEPTLDDSLDFARRRAPTDSAPILDGASVSRSGRTLTVRVSGRVDTYISTYQSVLQAPFVQALLGQSVGQPAVGLVPADAELLGYIDASVLGDPATRALATSLANGNDGASIVGTVDDVRLSEAVDPTATRSVTVFARNVSDNASTDAAAIVQADWNRSAVASTLNDTTGGVERATVGDQSVFVLGEDDTTWVAVCDAHTVVGDPAAVRATLAVTDGARPAVTGPLTEQFDRLPARPVRVVSRPPPLSSVFGDLLNTTGRPQYVGVTLGENRSDAVLQTDLVFADEENGSTASAAAGAVVALLATGTDDEQLRRVLESTTVDQRGRVVAVDSRGRPEDIAALLSGLLSGEGLPGVEEGEALSARAPPPEPPTRRPTEVSP